MQIALIFATYEKVFHEVQLQVAKGTIIRGNKRFNGP